MRDALNKALLALIADPRFVFMTGDLGFGALEALRDAAGERFINAGVAEQNMVAAAAGMARAGLRPWIYSIAPFIYARPFEQIRNDVCLHDLPVKLIGNGGGYAYGVMGATHHALEDYGVLLCLPNMRVFVPAFDTDVAAIVEKLADFPHPAYLRLGRCERPANAEVPPYSAWRNLLEGDSATIAVVGPLAGGVWNAARKLPAALRPDVWAITELPVSAETLPPEFLASVRRTGHLIVAEEHVAQGGVGPMLAALMLTLGLTPRFTHRCAAGYLSGYYGSQRFHREECGLDPAGILRAIAAGENHAAVAGKA